MFFFGEVVWYLQKQKGRKKKPSKLKPRFDFFFQQGNAIWLTLGATVALILGTCTAACGSCGRFATGRMGGEKY